eukprot:5837386-Amphidinium_carterae.1
MSRLDQLSGDIKLSYGHLVNASGTGDDTIWKSKPEAPGEPIASPAQKVEEAELERDSLDGDSVVSVLSDGDSETDIFGPA